MDELVFDFCVNSRVAESISPEEPEVTDFNGWSYHPAPNLPFRPSYRVMLDGLTWYQNTDGTLDLTTSPETNAGRLEQFYRGHRLHKPFLFNHEYLGGILMRFSTPVSVPMGLIQSGGLIDRFEINMIQHEAEYI